MPTSIVNRVRVLGGVSAGFIAAVTLKRRRPQLNVTEWRSADIGVIGVGARGKCAGGDPPSRSFGEAGAGAPGEN